ncbi:nuclear transport factor 2 family protein [Mycolicibacterium murale]|jgi:ketosteroid isomerase-like protein|nr:nuclear transport factor 2 family protein [Mycolicibacterium murale]ANW63619.1 hypothetical protein BCA37_08405 [Mycobacterium sp. djl-10]
MSYPKMLAVLVCSLIALAAAPRAGAEEAAPDNITIVAEAFNRGVGAPDTFYGILADDVHWTVARAEAPSTYTSRQEFLANGSGPITSRLNGQITAEVHELIAQGDQVVARWRGTATARDGLPYVNEYNWVMTMAGGQVTRVVAYLDLVALDELLTRVPV